MTSVQISGDGVLVHKKPEYPNGVAGVRGVYVLISQSKKSY